MPLSFCNAPSFVTIKKNERRNYYGYCSLIKATNSVLDKMKKENVTHAKVTSTARIERGISCVPSSILPTIYQYFWRVRFAEL